MAQLCTSYLRNKILKQKNNKGLQSRLESRGGDEYGFLPLKDTNGRRSLGHNPKASTKVKAVKTWQSDKENMPQLGEIRKQKSEILTRNQKENTSSIATSSYTSPLYYSLDSPIIKNQFMKSNKSHKKECKRSLFKDISRNGTDVSCTSSGIKQTGVSTAQKWSKPLAEKRTGNVGHSNSNLLNLNYPKTTQEVEEALAHATESKPANVLMVAVKTHVPSLSESNELHLQKGTVVSGLFRTRKWICIRLPSHVIGYVPIDCLDPIGVKKCKDFGQQFPTWITLDDKPVFQTIIQQQANISNTERSGYKEGVTADESVYVQADDVPRNIYSNMSKMDSTRLGTDSGIRDNTKSSLASYTACYPDKQSVHVCIQRKLPQAPVICGDDGNSIGQALTCDLNKDSAILKQTSTTSNDQDNGYESSAGECGSACDFQKSLSDLSLSHDSGRESTEHEHSVNASPEPVQIGSNRTGQESNTTLCSHNLTVLFDYNRKDRHDISIKKADIVELVHDKHKDWLWVRNQNGEEGYIPKNFVVNLEALNLDPHTKTTYF